MALSGIIYGSTNNEYIDSRIVWSATQNIANNTSTITATLSYIRNNSGYTTHGNLRGSITINGSTTSGVKEVWITNGHWEDALTATKTITHNNDGTKSITISATGYINNTSLDNTNLSGTITLDTIHRKADIVSAPNFNDEENPTITYSNPAGNSLTSLQACISLTGAADDIAYRDISKTGTSYTFNLTAAERNVLRNATTGKSRAVRFYVKSVIAGNTSLSYLEKTLSITNANPVLSPTVRDSNTKTVALTGDTNSFVKYYSNAAITFNATAQKGATIKSQKLTNGNKTLTANGTINAVESGSFVFSATDSRGFTTNKTLSKTLINYVKLTCDIKKGLPTTDGKYTVNVSGNFFNGSFGYATNTLIVYYRYKAESGDFGEWVIMTTSKSGNKYTATATVSGLDYQTAYTFEAYAVDKLETTYAAAITVKAVPVFDWGKDDFNVNGTFKVKGKTVLRNNGDNNNIILSAEDALNGVFIRPNGTGSNEGQAIFDTNGKLTLNGDIAAENANFSGVLTVNGQKIGENKLLWSGAHLMNGNQTITLAEPISQQTSGIVLVFSRYNGSSADDANFNHFFISKHFVSLMGGTGSAFTMNTVDYSTMATKYLYINDTTIRGNDLNNALDAGHIGIAYNNASYVLRYVIGV